MSLELKAIEKKVGEETHIYQTDLRFEKNEKPESPHRPPRPRHLAKLPI